MCTSKFKSVNGQLMYKLSKRFTIIIITITVGLSAQGQQPTE